jgi:hypothetical protein
VKGAAKLIGAVADSSLLSAPACCKVRSLGFEPQLGTLAVGLRRAIAMRKNRKFLPKIVKTQFGLTHRNTENPLQYQKVLKYTENWAFRYFTFYCNLRVPYYNDL